VFVDLFAKVFLGFGFTVNNKDTVKLFKALHPVDQLFLIGMGREAIDGIDFGFDDYILFIDLDNFSSINDFTSQSSFDLIAYKDQSIFFVPQAVLEVLPNPTAITHACSCNDNAPLFFIIDFHRFMYIKGIVQVGKIKNASITL